VNTLSLWVGDLLNAVARGSEISESAGSIGVHMISDTLTLSDVLARGLRSTGTKPWPSSAQWRKCSREDPVNPLLPELHQVQISAGGRVNVIAGTAVPGAGSSPRSIAAGDARTGRAPSPAKAPNLPGDRSDPCIRVRSLSTTRLSGISSVLDELPCFRPCICERRKRPS
jgi:hypothetical protein